MHSGAEKLNLAYSADFNVTQTFRFETRQVKHNKKYHRRQR